MQRRARLLALVAQWTLLASCSGTSFSGTTGGLHDGGGESPGAGGRASSGDGGQGVETGGRSGSGNSGGAGNRGSGGQLAGGAGGRTSAGGSVGSGGSVVGVVDASAPDAARVDCVNPAECPASSSVCEVPACAAGKCVFAAASTPPAQVVGDCLQSQCVTNGTTAVLVIKADDSDSSDGKECTKDACSANGPVHTPQAGISCNSGKGHCDTAGNCLECAVNAECGVSTECSKRVCTAGTCKTVQTPRGSLCNFPPGSVDADQCDGTGHCVECTDSGGCDEASTCNAMQSCIPA